MKKLFLVGLFAVAAANATITPELLVVSSTGPYCDAGPAAGQCTYEYEAVVPSVHQLRSGDFFTIYDFAGFIEGSVISAPTGWTGSAQKVGVDPTSPMVIIPDNPNMWNITWTYNGSPTTVGQEMTFSGFRAVSDFSGVASGWYSAQSHKPGGVTVGGRLDANGGQVDVPAPGPGEDNPVPEPMSMALLSGGLAALGLLRLRKQS